MYGSETSFSPLFSHIIFIHNFVVIRINKSIICYSITQLRFATETLSPIIVNK